MIDYFKERNLNDIKHSLTMGEDYNTKDSLPVQDVLNILEGLGCNVDLESFESSGWQYDWWYNFEYEGRHYTVSGSGYYGNLSIYREDS